MDFTFTEEQETIAKVARQLFEHRATPDHLTDLEAGEVRYDAGLWRELATADLLGIALPENAGGSGHGFLELALLLTEVGWSVAPVPVYATLLLGADTIARHGDARQQQRHLPDVVNGNRLLTAGLTEPGRSDPTAPATTARRDGDGWRIDGSKELVPAAQVADTMVIPAAVDDGGRNRHRHHLSPVPLLPVGQAQRARARFGDSAAGTARRRVLTKRNDRCDFAKIPHRNLRLA
jgi:3-oxocholest-4-en-26-oyl-CoA dehydrogenase beta subunit